MENFSKNIIKEIERKHISPRPRWLFVLRDAGTWILSGILLTIGSMVIAAAWFSVLDGDWDLYAYLGNHPIVYILQNIPYFLIAIAMVLFGLVFLVFRRTRSGYHYAAGAVIIGTITIGMVAGGMFFGFGAGERIEKTLSSFVPFYTCVEKRSVDRWTDPARGLLTGTVERIDSTTQFLLVDLNGVEWTVVAPSGTAWRPGVLSGDGVRVRLLGSPVLASSTTFYAKKVESWAL